MGVTILLICAVLASLSAGVLAAYALCIAMFKVFHIHAVRKAKARTDTSIQALLES